MYMDKVYNLYNVEASFRTFLTAGNKPIQPVTVKNYLSDLRHFLGWLVLRLKAKNVDTQSIDSNNLSDHLNLEEIAQYRAYLEKNNIPEKTINRRLSTLRKFCTFCISQGWMHDNPAKQVQNIVIRHDDLGAIIQNDLILESYKENLIEEGLRQEEARDVIKTIENVLSL